MTTIAYRDGVLAADTQAMSGDSIVGTRERKIGKLPSGNLYAMVGGSADLETFVRWLIAGRRDARPKCLTDNSVVILVRPRVIEVHQERGFYIERSPFQAWGSGKMAALAAMHLGAGAIEAVRVAIKVDPYSGGRVRCLRRPGW